jgi:Tol biopolymer transport system component
MTKKYSFFKSLVPLIPRICLIVTVALVALSFGCGVPQEQKVTEAPDLLNNIHGKLIYATYSLNHENDTFTVTYKNLYMLDLDAESHNADMLTELQFVNKYGPLYTFSRASWINGLVPSPDTTKIAFFKEDGLYIYDIKNKQLTKITEYPGISIAWHPDGQSLAVVLYDRDLHIVKADGTIVDKIAEHKGGYYSYSQNDPDPEWIESYIKHPTWALNGSMVFFDDFMRFQSVKSDEELPNLIYAYDTKTKKETSLFNFYERKQNDSLTTSWKLANVMASSSQSPEKEELFISADGDSRLIRYDSDRKKWKDVEQTDIRGDTFLLSTVKGKFISFYERYSDFMLYYDNYQMKTISLSGLMKEAWGGVWSNDGRYVAITGNSGIMFLEPSTQNITRLKITVDNGEFTQLVEWY